MGEEFRTNLYTKTHRFVIPKNVRKAYGIEQGNLVVVEITKIGEREVEVIPLPIVSEVGVKGYAYVPKLLREFYGLNGGETIVVRLLKVVRCKECHHGKSIGNGEN